MKVHLIIYPNGVGKGQGTHVSALFFVDEVIIRYLQEYDVSIDVAERKKPVTNIVICHRLECTSATYNNSTGKLQVSIEQFLKIEEATSLLVNDSIIVELTLKKHEHAIH